jgi:hypothetical protein
VKREPRSRERRLGRASGSTAIDKFGSICSRKMSTVRVSRASLITSCPTAGVSLKTRERSSSETNTYRRSGGNLGKSDDLKGERKKEVDSSGS